MTTTLDETILIECSRPSSIEGATRNDTEFAEWTCDTGNGLVLEVGDTISLHSGFVSEIGAQSGEIEIKERDRVQTYPTYISRDIGYEIPNTPVPQKDYLIFEQANVYEYAAEKGGEVLANLAINDGETNIVYSPYKTTNGEFYASLPRRHIGWNPAISAPEGNTNVWKTFDCQTGNPDPQNVGAAVVGNTIYTPSGEDQRTLAPGYVYPYVPWQFCPADYKLVGQFARSYIDGLTTDASTRKGMIRNDNSRYTIFRMDQVYRTRAAAGVIGGSFYSGLGGATGIGVEVAGTQAYQNRVDRRDPALLANWTQVKEVMTIKSKAGFNSPNDVAEEITQQMNLRSDLINENVYAGGSEHYDYIQTFQQKQLGYYTSPSIKPYNCASSAWSYERWNAFRKVVSPVESVTDDAHFYMSMYQHIGVKRPELWVQGRATGGSDANYPERGFLIPSVGPGSNTNPGNQVLNLAIPWSVDNLENLNNLFDKQSNYPELFPTKQLTQMSTITQNHNLQGVDYHRFIHINGQDEAPSDPQVAFSADTHYPLNTLGYDCYGPIEGDVLPTFYNYSEKSMSYPLFFDYNKDTANFRATDVGYTDSLHRASDIGDLAYGWARKVRIPADISESGVDEFYIGIQFTRTGNLIPAYLFNGQTHIAQTGTGGRRFGFDWHFSAYGSACINLYSGVVDSAGTGQVGEFPGTASDQFNEFHLINYVDSYAKVKVGDPSEVIAAFNTGPYYRQLLLGADSPALSYSSDTSRFSFTNLHIGERIGNVANAGKVAQAEQTGPPVVAGIPGVDANPNASAICYKVNKALLGNSYCPNMAPYGETIPADREMPDQLPLSLNYEAWTPYDATCGLFIEQVAVPEEIWSDNLIGVLGFFYSQFNNDDTTRQVTINNRADSSNLAALTTQAPINAADVIEWSKNGYGYSNYSLTLPMAYTRRFTSEAETTILSFRNIFPPVTVQFQGSDSTKITALQLPTKTARPYYTIRSDIVPSSSFIGGNGDLVRFGGATNRPVVSIVNKINGYGDFYSQQDNQITFTNTMKRVITSIKTSVHDPDGSYAKVNKNSSVIYKIVKTRNVDLNPVQTLLQSKLKSDQLAGEQASAMLVNMADAVPNYSDTFQFTDNTSRS